MKKITVLISFILITFTLFSQNYRPVDEGSLVKFAIKNFGINVTGTFTGLEGNIIFNLKQPSTSDFKVSVNASTINTDNGKRDKDLKMEKYFNVKNYPRLSFASIKITGDATALMMQGRITIKGVTKTISFPFKAVPRKDDYLFTGEFNLNRRDFNVGGNNLILSDDLHVTLEIYGKKI